MADSIRIEGLDAFARALRLLPQNVGRNVLRGGVSAAARVIVTEARVRVPASTGTLRRSIIQKQIRERSDLTRQTFYVTVRHGRKYRKQGKKGTLSQDAYLNLEPIGEAHANARSDYRAGVLAATVANYAGKTRIDGAEPAHPADFFASLDDHQRAPAIQAPLLMRTPEDQAQLIKASLFGIHDG